MKKLTLVLALAFLLPLGAQAKLSSSPVQFQTVLKELSEVNELLGGNVVVLQIDDKAKLEKVLSELQEVKKLLNEGKEPAVSDYIHLACRHPACG